MLRFIISILFTVVFFNTGWAAGEITDEERKAAWTAADAASVQGPKNIDLGEQAIFHLPDDMLYIPVKESTELMRTWGNSVDGRFHGLVTAKDNNSSWTLSIDFTNEGYVKDDDAKSWNAAELLQSLKDGTEAQNAERIKLGIPALDVVDWVQAPLYDSSKHQLAWSLKAVDRGAEADARATINFNTYALGKDGYFQLNLMTNDQEIEVDKPAAFKVVSAIDYKPGKKYSDFKEGTDHVAEYGLAALVGGIAAKKLGLLALGGVFLAKFAKIIFAAIALGAGGFFKFFRRKKDDTEA
jgi:uncharacterized membrane-anchored protein